MDAPPNLKRHYLKFFFEVIYIDGKKIAKVVETPIFSTLRRQHHIIIRSNWLEKWEDFRKIDWKNYPEYPECTLKDIDHFLHA